MILFQKTDPDPRLVVVRLLRDVEFKAREEKVAYQLTRSDCMFPETVG